MIIKNKFTSQVFKTRTRGRASELGYTLLNKFGEWTFVPIEHAEILDSVTDKIDKTHSIKSEEL